MAAHLAAYGWQYVVVDIQWYEPKAQSHGYRPNAELVLDEFGRLLPAVNRFPSAANGVGFKALADYIHSKDLKFGIHILRGIPRLAVEANLPILNTTYHAQDIANVESMSPWIDDMYGIDMTKPGAQGYYDSIVALYKSWDVDYIKADDILWPYHAGEIEALSQAINTCGRDIMLSLSPGVELSVEHAEHLKLHSELWRISADFWDRWEDLKAQFGICKMWEAHITPNAWPDADMLPLGRIGIRAERGVDRQSLLTHDEQITLMTLWAIFRSPLMFGGDLPSSDEFTLKLLTNAEVLRVNQASCANRELFQRGEQVVWTADAADSHDKYIALFNIGEELLTQIEVDVVTLGITGRYEVRNLWSGADLRIFEGAFRQDVSQHSAKLFRLRSL